MSDRYKPNGTPLTDHERELLVILMEECAEVTQAASKLLRFGKETRPDTHVSNSDVLAAEIGDLEAVIRFVMKAALIDGEIMVGAIRHKEGRLAYYMQTDPAALRAMPLQERVWPQSRQVPENWRPVPCDGLQKIMALLPPPPLTQDGLTHRFEGPNPHDTIYAIRAAFIEMLHAKPVLVEDRTEGEGMKLEISKDWCLRAAEREGDSEVGAGAIAMDPTLCDDCPPFGYPTDKTRCAPCPRRMVAEEGTKS